MSPKIDFENLEAKLKKALLTPQWKRLVKDFKACSHIYFIGNGGLASNASHAASDTARLTDKKAHSLDNMSLFTSLANDYGYSEVFKNWVALCIEEKTIANSMVIAFSGSGNSPNVINCLHWANNKGLKTVLLSGQKSEVLNESINEVVLNTNYFHTHEIITCMLFYEQIGAAGGSCPTIKNERIRKNKERTGKK